MVTVNVTDFTNYEVKKVKIAINERGCIYPSITIEEDGKVRKGYDSRGRALRDRS